MKTRCKPGDLAVVVQARSSPWMMGRLVHVVRSWQEGERTGGVNWDRNNGLGHMWVIKAANGQGLPVSGYQGVYEVGERPYPDFALRPIRDNEDEDESLAWCAHKESEAA